jgi:hypothetical protein
MWPQTLFVILIVAASLIFLLVQLRASLSGKRSRLGSCCAKGCQPTEEPRKQGTAFIPSELLIRRK